MIKWIKIFACTCVMFTVISCKSVRKVTSKDNSTTESSRRKAKRKVEFIDGIEITPGSVVKSKHKPATTKSKSIEIDAPTNLPATTKIKDEQANHLQMKYAIMLDTYVENIANLELFNKIEEWWGTRYCMGGHTKECIDCSAFTGIILRDIYKINLPRTAAEQYSATNHIDRSELQEGDLVFFGGRRYINHVGIYLCNNKFVHASTSNGVTISDLDEHYWRGKFAGCGRAVGE